MSYRNRAAKPSLVLWLLVAIGNVALILVSGWMIALVTLGSVVTVAAVVGTLALRRSAGAEPVPDRS